MKNWQIVAIVVGAIIIGIGAGYYLSNSGSKDQSQSGCRKSCPVEERTYCPSDKCQTSNILEDEKAMKVDRVNRLYSRGSNKLPFVETITYTHHVPWLRGRSALMSDYARHYRTSAQFISRSITNGEQELSYPKLSQGDSFNVIRSDKNIEFFLVVDLSRHYMHMYAYDVDLGERYLLKTYTVGVGALDPHSTSGCETPCGKFELSKRVGIYKPGVVSNVGGRVMELVQVYGTRYIPFDDKYTNLGIQGNPWMVDSDTGELIEMRNFIGQYATDGNIRMHTEDMEQLFSIVTSRRTTVEIVKKFNDAQLPGYEVDY